MLQCQQERKLKQEETFTVDDNTAPFEASDSQDHAQTRLGVLYFRLAFTIEMSRPEFRNAQQHEIKETIKGKIKWH